MLTALFLLTASTLPAEDRTLAEMEAAGEVTVLGAPPRGHHAAVTSGSWSQNGRMLVTSSYDGTAKIWRARDGELQGDALRLETGVLFAATCLRDKQVVVSLENGEVSLRDPKSWKVKRELGSYEPSLSHCALSADGALLAAAPSLDGPVRLFDLTSRKPPRELDPLGLLGGLAVSDDGQYVALGGAGAVRVVRAETGETVWEQDHGMVSSVAFSPDGKALACGLHDKLLVLDAGTGDELGSVSGHGTATKGVTFSPDGKRVFFGEGLALESDGGRVHVYDREEDAVVLSVFAHSGAVADLSLSKDGKVLASCGFQDFRVRLWDSATGAELHPPKGHTNGVSDVAFTPDGSQIVSTDYDGNAVVWDVKRERVVEPTVHHPELYVSGLACLDDGRVLLGTYEGHVLSWQPKEGLAEGMSMAAATTPEGIVAMAVTEQKRRLLTGQENGYLKLYNLDAGKNLVLDLEPHGAPAFELAFNPKGTQFVVLCQSNHSVYETNKGKRVWSRNTAEKDLLTRLAYTDDDHFVAADNSGRLQKMTAENGSIVWQVELPDETFAYDVTASPDAKTVAVACTGPLAFFSAETGELLGKWQPVDALPQAVAYSRDGARVAIGLADGRVVVRDVE